MNSSSETISSFARSTLPYPILPPPVILTRSHHLILRTIHCIIHGLLNYLLPVVYELRAFVYLVDASALPFIRAPRWQLPSDFETRCLSEYCRRLDRAQFVVQSVLCTVFNVLQLPLFFHYTHTFARNLFFFYFLRKFSQELGIFIGNSVWVILDFEF